MVLPKYSFLIRMRRDGGENERENYKAISVSELLRQPAHHETMPTLIKCAVSIILLKG